MPIPTRRAHLFNKKIFSPPPPIHASAPSPPIPDPPGASDRSSSLPVTFYNRVSDMFHELLSRAIALCGLMVTRPTDRTEE
jgi:hypothetical protein